MINHRWIQGLFSAVLILGILLSGCQVQNQPASTTSFIPRQIAATDCGYGGEISSVQSLDQNTVVFTLCKPDTAFLSKISSPIFAIQDEDALNQAGGDSAALAVTPNGTGAYRLSQYTPGGELVLEPSPTYWGIPPKPQKITIRWVPVSITRFHAFQTAKADVLLSPPSGLMKIARETTGLKEISQIGLNTIYVGINNKSQPMDNPKVRQAMATLIDRETITHSFMVEGSEIASQLIPSNINPGFSANIPWYTTDADTAKALLLEAGFDFNQTISLAYPDQGMPGVDSPADIANEIKNEMAAIGVTLDLKQLSENDLRASIAAGGTMLYLYWFAADYPDGLAFFEKPFINDIGILGENYPDVVQAVENLKALKGENERQKAFNSANRLMKDIIPVVPIAHALDVVFARDSVKNLITNGVFENLEDASTLTGQLLIYAGNEPKSFWPADETDPETFEITRLLYDTLLTPAIEGKGFKPLLAESWETSQDLTQWTFHLRYDVHFSNGSSLDANDVVASFGAIWDNANRNHKGRSGDFAVFKSLFGKFIN